MSDLQFVVETGAGLSTATSYVTLDELKQYWTDIGYSYASLSDAELQVLANRASRIIDTQYAERWPGVRRLSTQRFQWPRTDAHYRDGHSISYNIVPQEVKNAVLEMAYVVNAGTDPQPIDTDAGELESERVSVAGAVSESKSYFQGTARSHPKIAAVSDALSPLIASSPYGGMNIVRV